MNAITKLVIVCQNSGALSDRDVYIMRKLIIGHSLVNVDLTSAKFVATTDGTNSTEDLRITEDDAKSMCAKFDGETDDSYNTAMANNRPYARYKDEWGYPHYGVLC